MDKRTQIEKRKRGKSPGNCKKIFIAQNKTKTVIVIFLGYTYTPRKRNQPVTDESSSNDSDNENSDTLPPSKRIRNEWNPVMSFNSRDAMEKYVDDHDCFYEHSSNISKDGTTTYYYCSIVAAKCSTKCPAKLKVFENSATTAFGVSVTTMIHDHSGLKLRKNIFSDAMKTEIYTLNQPIKAASYFSLVCFSFSLSHFHFPCCCYCCYFCPYEFQFLKCKLEILLLNMPKVILSNTYDLMSTSQ